MRDESDRQGLRLVIELQRGAEPESILTSLFKLTPLQETFGIIMLALVDNEPRLLTLKQCLKVYLDHRLEVIRRRSEYELARARERAHILEGLLKALDKMDAVISTIRKSQTVETARTNLIKLLAIDEVQAQAILDMQLRRLAALERKKIEDEYKEKVNLIKYLEGLLQSPQKMREVIVEELTTIKQAYGDRRRSVIADGTASSAAVGALVMPSEDTWVTLTIDGKLGRSFEYTPPKVTADIKDPPRFILDSNTAQIIYLFTADGQCATIPVHQLPQVHEPLEGSHFSDLSALPSDADVTALVGLPPNLVTGYLFLATQGAEVKRLRVEDVPGLRADAFVVMNVENGDRLGWVMPTNGENEIVLITAQGQAIRFSENDVRPTGLPAGGMRGVKLGEGEDRVVAAMVAIQNQFIWSITDDGIAKISPIEDYPVQGRAGSGVIAMRLPKGSTEIAAGTIGRPDDNIIALTNRGKPYYMRLGRAVQIPRGRPGGDIVISVKENERIVSVVNYQPRVNGAEPE
jgi:DNA gyrase subunit A